ncbi:paramyosin, partial [Asbolus verrucosus]
VTLENANYLKSQLASQLEDARRRAEDDERRRSLLEAQLHQVEIELESIRVQLEEESEARLDLERQLVKSQGELQVYKSKYEAECVARAEEVEELRRKYTARITEQEEHIEALLVKVNNLEKQKSRLQSEVEVLIIDLEKANNTARELQKRVEQLERINIDLKTRLEETVNLYEQSQRDLRNKQQELQRTVHELDKTRELKDQLARENKKLADDLGDARNTITELTRRIHELELELRRLENERDELTAAYKEAEAGRKAEELRSQRLASEFGQFRHEAERRLQEKDEEIEAIRYSHEALDKQASAKERLRDFTAKRSFQLGKSASAAVITERNYKNKPQKEIVRQIQTLKSKMADDLGYDPDAGQKAEASLKSSQKYLRGKSARAIAAYLTAESLKNIGQGLKKQSVKTRNYSGHLEVWDKRAQQQLELSFQEPLESLSKELKNFDKKSAWYFFDKSKATSIEIEQLNARVVEAETRLKTEVARIKKKLQIQITELEMSLDSANKINIDLQKTIKKQSLQLTELTAHYDEVQRQLQVTLDQLSVSQRKVQALTAETEEIRGNYESALRGKRAAEQAVEEAGTRINELTTINVNLASAKSKIEQELTTVVADYDEITKELRISDERYQRIQNELKHTVEILHEEQERVVKIEAIKKSLEIEVKNLSVRLEEVEANAIVGGKRIISKLEARLRDLEVELDEEKRRHAETIKILRKKERTVKEVMIQCEEDQKNIALLQESLEKSNLKVSMFKRQLQEQEGMSQQSVTRVRRFQRELEAAEDRADTAESNLSLIRAKHRTFVTTSSVPGSQVYLVQESRSEQI